MDLPETLGSQRRERAVDSRGLPNSYARALVAFEKPCAHCEQRAAVVTGVGVGLCRHHQHEQVSGRDRAIRERQRLQQQIDALRRE